MLSRRARGRSTFADSAARRGLGVPLLEIIVTTPAPPPVLWPVGLALRGAKAMVSLGKLKLKFSCNGRFSFQVISRNMENLGRTNKIFLCYVFLNLYFRWATNLEFQSLYSVLSVPQHPAASREMYQYASRPLSNIFFFFIFFF